MKILVTGGAGYIGSIVVEQLIALGSRTHNLGNGQGFTVKEVVETAREVTGRSIPVAIGPRRPGDPAVLVASSEAIRRELGWAPQHTGLATIVESAWRWHLAHPNGYDNV